MLSRMSIVTKRRSSSASKLPTLEKEKEKQLISSESSNIGDDEFPDDASVRSTNSSVSSERSLKDRILSRASAAGKNLSADKKCLVGWVKCSDMITGESYYMNVRSGETSDMIPGLLLRTESLMDIDEKGASAAGNVSVEQKGRFEDDLDPINRIVEIESSIGRLVEFAKSAENQKKMNAIQKESIDLLEECRAKLWKVLELEDGSIGSADRLMNVSSLLVHNAHITADFNGARAANFRSKLLKYISQDLSYISGVEITEENAHKMRRLRFSKQFQDVFNKRQELSETKEAPPPLEVIIPRYMSETPLFSGLDSISMNVTITLPSAFFLTKVVKYSIRVTENPDDFLSKIFPTLTKVNQNSVFTVSDFILKIKRYEEFLFGKHQFISFNHIRNCLNNQAPVEFVLMIKSEVIRDFQEFFSQENAWKEWKSYEEKANQAPSHKSKNQNFLEYSEIQSKPFKLTISKTSFGDGDYEKLPGMLVNESEGLKNLSIQVFFIHGLNMLYNSPIVAGISDVLPIISWNAIVCPLGSKGMITYESIPRELKICFVLCRDGAEGETVPIAFNWIHLIDSQSKLLQGTQEMRLFPVTSLMLKNAKTSKFSQWDFLFRSSFGPATIQGHSKKDISEGVLGTITVDFEDFQLDVHRLSAESEYEISHTVKPNAGKLGSEIPVSKLAKEVQTRIQHICNKSILGNLEKEDKEFIWMARHGLTHRPEALLKFLMSTDWTDVDYRNEAYRLMKTWKYPRNLPEVVELLGPEVADSCARNFAVDLLYAYDWVQIREVIPQLIQALKHEPYTFSSLSLFLLIRAVIDPITIGNDLFWYFKLEMNRPIHAEKFGLLLEALISLCGPYGIEYTKQNAIISRLERIGEAVAISKARGLQKKEVLGIYRSQLQNINDRILSQVKSWRNPLNPTMVLGLLDCEKCRYMSSKMAPLWLVFRNKDASASCTSIILKIGDDVRQDILTLQCMRMFELNWRSKDIDLKMSPYVCLATGVSSQKRGVGLIEVVENADTTSHIHWEYGGRFGALQRETLCRYLEHHNTDSTSYDQAVDLFMRSTAGYCVSTYVLGIGDRHNGNIMIKHSGQLFHIDFGHILGNFKSKAGINRERAAFVFTPEMAYIIARKSKNYKKDANFKRFVQICVESYQVLREQSRGWVALVRMMLPAGIPELRKLDDINYLSNMLMENVLPSESTKKLEAEIEKSVSTKWRLFDNLVHTWIHEA